MNGYLIFILAVLAGSFLLDLVLDLLNLRSLSPELPAEFQGLYDADRYARSQQYLRDTTRFGCVENSVQLAAIIAFICAGGFNWVDHAARGLGAPEIVTGLVFTGMLLMAAELLAVPFAACGTFVIEERYGFNKTTAGTFILDRLKGWLLIVVFGAPVMALVLWFFQTAGSLAWLYCWLAVTAVQVFMLFIAPVVIMPLFNTFTPLPDGELKDAIVAYANSQQLALKGIYTMDGSRRSTKSNAFFTGMGRYRRIVLFDTLIARHSPAELVAVLAHEAGHLKKGHILKRLAMSIVSSGIMFYLLSFFLENEGLSRAFAMDHVSVYATLCFFAFLYTPLDMFLSTVGHVISRKHEFAADRYSAKTTGGGRNLIGALKKLSIDNLSNLTPHPAMVFFKYSHPPVLERIMRLRQLPA